MYNIVTYHTLDETLIKRWHTLWENSPEGHFFNTPEWFEATRTIYHIKEFTIVTIEEDGELVLVLPLVTKKVFGVPVLSSPGGKFLNKSTLLIRDINKQVLLELRDFLMKQGNFYLQELSSELADILSAENNRVTKHEASINPYLHISPDPFSQLSSKNRSQIRGLIRKYEQDLSFKYVTGDQKALEIVFEIDNRSSKNQQGKGTFITKEDKEFFRELLRLMPEKFTIDIVSYKEVPIIYGIGFIYKNIYHAYITAFDGTYRFLKPGKILAYFILKRLQDEQFAVIDFARGNSALKQEFTKLAAIQYNVFYIESFLSNQWLVTAQKIYTGILQNKPLYSTYLFFKKFVLYR